jgi:hypothetical protein
MIPGDLIKPDFAVRNLADNDAGTLLFVITQVNPTPPASGTVLFYAMDDPNGSYAAGQYANGDASVRNNVTYDFSRLTDMAGAADLQVWERNGYQTGYIGKWHLSGQEPVPASDRAGYEYWLAANVLEFVSDAYRTVLYDGENRPVELPGYRVDAMTETTRTIMGTASTAMRSSASPAVSASPTSVAKRSSTVPASMRSATRMAHTPMRRSPAIIARWIGAAPRHFGRSLGCRFTLSRPSISAGNRR